MSKPMYSKEFMEQALQKVFSRGDRSIVSVAQELNMSRWSLKHAMVVHRKGLALPSGESPRSSSVAPLEASYGPEQRLLALQESFGLAPEALNAWCRERGLFASQLTSWRAEFLGSIGSASAKEQASELRDLKVAHVKLGADLRRKEKALAEAAALLVLQKKFQALYSDEAL